MSGQGVALALGCKLRSGLFDQEAEVLYRFDSCIFFAASAVSMEHITTCYVDY
ncbi:Ff.00g065140.m01.CDS01 [Fusarium sp. VM40]|nr:Ff.00g065140.m01.CDS01 [Fusarium sp. VM40]